jgi:hypothetical protein
MPSPVASLHRLGYTRFSARFSQRNHVAQLTKETPYIDACFEAWQ